MSIATHGLASSAFARHYSRNLVWFLFLPLLRCFSSGGSPRIPIDSVYVPWFFIMGVPTFGNLRIEAYVQLPAAYRSLSRPSSAPNAKAFSICSSSLELPYVFDPSSNLRLLRINITVLSSLSLELLCVSYFAVTWSRFFYPPLAKLFRFTLFVLTKKPDFD